MFTVIITRRTRGIGWGYSTQPTGNGTEIAMPTRPQFEGTVKQVLAQRQSDPTLISLGGVPKKSCWFLHGHMAERADGQLSSTESLMRALAYGFEDGLRVVVVVE